MGYSFQHIYAIYTYHTCQTAVLISYFYYFCMFVAFQSLSSAFHTEYNTLLHMTVTHWAVNIQDPLLSLYSPTSPNTLNIQQSLR